jgi:MFS family permease
VLVAMYGLGGVFLYLMTIKTSTEMLYLIVGAVGACSTGAQIVAYAYCGQFYPMSIRSTGIGMAAGIGRSGAIAAPLLIGLIVSLKLPLEQNFLLIGAAGVIGAIALAFIDHKRSASTHQHDATPRASVRAANDGQQCSRLTLSERQSRSLRCQGGQEAPAPSLRELTPASSVSRPAD